MFNIDKVHIMLDEMVMNGYIIEANRAVIIDPLKVLEGKQLMKRYAETFWQRVKDDDTEKEICCHFKQTVI